MLVADRNQPRLLCYVRECWRSSAGYKQSTRPDNSETSVFNAKFALIGLCYISICLQSIGLSLEYIGNVKVKVKVKVKTKMRPR